MKDRIQKLRETIDHHNHQYYVLGSPEIPDAVFDRMFQKLIELEAQYPEFYVANSPSSRLGSDLYNSFNIASHITPMLSINAVQTVTEIAKFLAKGETIVQLKYDGVGVNLVYKNGKLHLAITRGDGGKGIDVTANIRTIANIPYSVNTNETIEIRGEVWCPWSELKRLQDLGENVHSPVAVAINSIKVKQSNRCAARNLSFTAYHLTEGIAGTSHVENVKWLKDNHFDVPITFRLDAVLKAIRQNILSVQGILKQAQVKDIPADGIVFKHNDLLTCKTEGYTSRAVNWAISWKFDKETFTAKVAGIGGKVAANGRVTPLVFIDPIVANNETICKIPITPADLDTGIQVGQTITIRRAGTRVAQIVTNSSATAPSEFRCPQCSSILVRRKNLFYCPINCYNIETPPAGEDYALVHAPNLASYSIDPAMAQYIAQQNNCRLVPVSGKFHGCKLYYNDLKQLADIGFAIGSYAKKFQATVPT